MNPENNTQMSEPVTAQQAPVATPHPVNQVTTFSKYFAISLFLLLPFIGGYVGYQLAPEKVVEVNALSPNTTDTQNQKNKFETIRYFKFSDTYAYTTDVNNPALHKISNVLVSDGVNELLQSKPILIMLSSTSNSIVLTSHCFKDTECGINRLLKFNSNDRSLTFMDVDEVTFFDENGFLFNKDLTKFITTTDQNNKVARVIDLTTDTYTDIDLTTRLSSQYTICNQGMVGCTIDGTWLNSNTIELVVVDPTNGYASTTAKISLE